MTIKWLQQGEGYISYEDAGEGPLVVCIPSLGDLRSEYRFLAPQLIRAGYRVIQMDLRGMGESSTGWGDYSVAATGDDLLALIRSLEAGPAFVAGTSMAAGAGAWAAVEEPELIAGLALIGPAVRGEVSAASRMFYRALFARPWGPAVWAKYYATLYPARKPSDFTEYVAALQRNLHQDGRMEATVRAMLAPKTASEQRLPYVTAPVRVIMGSKDPDFKHPETEARWVANQLHGEYFMVPDAGHYPHAEMPEIAGSLVIDFIKAYQPIREERIVA